MLASDLECGAAFEGGAALILHPLVEGMAGTAGEAAAATTGDGPIELLASVRVPLDEEGSAVDAAALEAEDLRHAGRPGPTAARRTCGVSFHGAPVKRLNR